MRIETLCTGDELLTGLTSDTNSRFFQTLLLEQCGLTVRRSTVVGDVREELIEVMNTLAARCDVVLVSGGLGPTTDDITIECAAEAANVAIVEDERVMAHIRARFEKRGTQSVADWHPQVLLATQLTPDGFPAPSAATAQPTHAPLKHAGPPPAAAQSALVMQPHVRLGRQVPPSLWELVELRLQSVSVVQPQTPLGRQARPEL